MCPTTTEDDLKKYCPKLAADAGTKKGEPDQIKTEVTKLR